MVPSLYPGDLVITKPAENYHVGDIVAYIAPGGYVIIHRIVGRVNSTCYITKGDANPVPDPWIVCKNNIVGKVILRIPLLGYVLDFVKSNPIMLVLAASLLGVVISLPVIAVYLHEGRSEIKISTVEYTRRRDYPKLSTRTLIILTIGVAILTLAMTCAMYVNISKLKDYRVVTLKIRLSVYYLMLVV